MAGKTKSMSQIKQMLLLKKQGVSNRKIASAISMNKETVNNYIRKVMEDPLDIDGLLKLEDPELEHRLKGGNPAYTDHRFNKFRELLPYFESEMKRRHVTLQLLWEEYRRDHPNGYSLTQFRFHYRQNTRAKKDTAPSTILKDTFVGGEKIFLDFAGDTLGYVDISTGEIIRVQAFVASLPASDYGYMLCVPSQRTDDYVYAIMQCFKHLGGVPRILVPDNLKAAVIKSDRYEPVINKVMEDMANHYGTVVIPARPVHPRDKSLVEDQVKIVYRRVYAGLRNRTLYSLAELNGAVAEKMKAHNQKRMQQHPYSREERFLAIEKPNLLPLPATDFEIRHYTDLKVEQNCCIYLGRDKHYYTVPYQYIGQKAHVIYTRSMVKVFIDGVQVASHIRDLSPGKYTIRQEHLASNSRAYRGRSPQTYIDKGCRFMPALGDVIRNIFYTSAMPPETHYRTCDALMALGRRTDPVVFKKACQTAIACGRTSLGFIRQLVDSHCASVDDRPSRAVPPQHKNIRGKSHFE
jgi:transposase